MKTKIEKAIMRRVYYSFAVTILGHPSFRQGFVLGACIALFGRLTHVASIYYNLSALPVMSAPQYIVRAFVHAAQTGEIFTVLVTLLMITLSIVFLRKVLILLNSLQRPLPV